MVFGFISSSFPQPMEKIKHGRKHRNKSFEELLIVENLVFSLTMQKYCLQLSKSILELSVGVIAARKTS